MTRMKRAYRGLYGNRMIQFGNKISFAENKSRRTWKPNVQVKTLFSDTLRKRYRFRVTTYVLRCIRKHGGFDQYLLKTRDSEIKYEKALEIKRQLREVLAQNQETVPQFLERKAREAGKLRATVSEPTLVVKTGEEDEEEPTQTAPHPVTRPMAATGITNAPSRGLLDLL